MAASKIYMGIIRRADPLVPAKLRPLWEHEAGKININNIKSTRKPIKKP